MNLATLWASARSRLSNRRFWRDSSLLMLANVIVMGLGLVRTPAMTWLLPKEEVGMMGVVVSWLPFLQLLSLPGLDGASYHYVAKGMRWAFFVNLTQRLRWSLWSVAGFLVGAVFWWWRGNPLLAWMFVIAAVSCPATVGLTAAAGTLGALEDFSGLFWYRIVEGVARFVGFIPLVLSVWWMSRAVTFYGANQVAAALLQIGVSVWLLWRLSNAWQSPLPAEDAREMVRYGKHLTLINGIGVVQSRTDALLVGSLLSLEIMADYSIALLVYEQFKRLWSVYLSVRYPPLVRLVVARRQRRMLVEGGIVWLGFIGMGFIISLLARWLVPLVLPAAYISSLTYVNWLIATFVISVPGFLAETYFRTQQDERLQYVMRGAAAVVGVLLPALLIGALGAYGVVIGRFLGGVVLSILGLGLFWRKDVRKNGLFTH